MKEKDRHRIKKKKKKSEGNRGGYLKIYNPREISEVNVFLYPEVEVM